MATRFSFLLCAALVLHLLSCANGPTPSGPAQKYLNEGLGIQIDFGEEWLLYTSRESAPFYFKSIFPLEKDPNISPLYAGARVGNRAFARALVDPVEANTLRYFEAVISVFAEDLEIISARYSAEADAVRWIYRIRNGVLDNTFHETLSVTNGMGYRLAFWSATTVFENYVSEFDELSTRFLFKQGNQWHASYEGINDSFSDEGLEFVQLTPQITEEREPNQCVGERRGLLWRVEHEGGILHLFGSIHLGHPDFYPLPGAVEQALQDSRYLVLEANPNNPENKNIEAEVLNLGTLPDGQTLEDVLSPVFYRRLVGEMEEIGLPIGPFSNLRPWLLSLSISIMKFQSYGYQAEYGVEEYLLAKEGDREVLELESLQEQLELISSFDGELFLEYTLASLDDFDEMAEAMVTAWYCGQEDTLIEILLSDHSEKVIAVEEILERLIFDRNETMAESIEKLMTSPGNHFVAVGAGHLIGPRGLPALLRSRGFDVVRQ